MLSGMVTQNFCMKKMTKTCGGTAHQLGAALRCQTEFRVPLAIVHYLHELYLHQQLYLQQSYFQSPTYLLNKKKQSVDCIELFYCSDQFNYSGIFFFIFSVVEDCRLHNYSKMKFRTNELFKNQIPRIYRHVNNKVNITDSSIFSQFTTFTLKYN